MHDDDGKYRMGNHPLGRMILGTLAGLAGIGLAMILVAWARPVWAHEAPTGWSYPLRCCSNRDCNMVRAERVREGPNGYEVTLYPGDHDFVKGDPVSYVIPYDKAETSGDGAYHICISQSLKMLCFFAGARMF